MNNIQPHAPLQFFSESTCPPTPKKIASKELFSFFVPGRVNLIGEHMDYNGGLSLPFAIDKGIRFKIFVSDDWSGNEPESIVVREKDGPCLGISSRHSAPISPKESWPIKSLGTLAYLNGAWALASKTYARLENSPSGHAEIMLETTLPQGAGLSSSAALSLGLLTAFGQLLGVRTETLFGSADKPCSERAQLARLAQLVEHEYAGTPCGLMDQIAILETKPGHCLSLNFSKPSPNFAAGIPAYPDFLQVTLGELSKTHKLLVLDSGRKHSLSDGSYETRRSECGEALGRIISELPKNRQKNTNTLGQLFDAHPEVDLDFLQNKLEHSPKLLRRARFVFEERIRSFQAEEALQSGDPMQLDGLLSQAQDGLRELYEVSCVEIDRLVWHLRQLKTTLQETWHRSDLLIGGRMMGGGWGGSLILFALNSHLKQVEECIAEITKIYEQETGCRARLIETAPSPGLAFECSSASRSKTM